MKLRFPIRRMFLVACSIGVVDQRHTPCTLMFNYLDYESLRFSILESIVVRGHALEWAADDPELPKGSDPLPAFVGERSILTRSGEAICAQTASRPIGVAS